MRLRRARFLSSALTTYQGACLMSVAFRPGESLAIPVGGTCATGTIPIYRAYNHGQTGAPNHRFTSDVNLYNDFVTNQGWDPEGIRFCAPQ